MLQVVWDYSFIVFVFIVFLGTLIFFHELGHFIFARIFGVRVEVFSLGFGPKIFKYKWGDTEYAISLIPLGGYVKMFGDDQLEMDKVPLEERRYSFVYKGKWARFWIVFGGPLANFLLAYVIFFGLLLSGETVPENRFGYISESSSFYGFGIRSGDVLKKINGNSVDSPTDAAVEGRDRISTITVSRLDKEVELAIDVDSKNFFESYQGHSHLLREPMVVNKNGEVFALAFDDDQVRWHVSLETTLQTRDSSRITFYSVELDQKDAKIRNLGDVYQVYDLNWKSIEDFSRQLGDMGYRSLDLKIREVEPNSPADKAFIKNGDVVVSLNSKPVYHFEFLRRELQRLSSDEQTDGSVKMHIWRNGDLLDVVLKPELKKVQRQNVFVVGIYSYSAYLAPKLYKVKPKSIDKAIIKAFSKTWGSIATIAVGFKKIVTSEVALENVRGPVSIARFASDSLDISFSYFLQLMALISVNLGFINLFPIPILDGGHLMFIFVELINRGPVSRRKLEIAQQLGLSLLIFLMVLALYNDIIHF